MPDGQTLGQAPAPELQALREVVLFDSSAVAIDDRPTRLFDDARAFELVLELVEEPEILTVDVLADADGEEVTRILFDSNTDRIRVDKSRSTLSSEGEGPAELEGVYDRPAFGDIERIRVFVDGSVVEVFVNDAAAFSFRSYPSKASSTGVAISGKATGTAISTVRAWSLRHPD
jgi:sucrose-6-phosphate hydrolase SacC (GH32 family)